MSHRLLQFARVFYFYLPTATLAAPSSTTATTATTASSSEENAAHPTPAPFLSFSQGDDAVRRENESEGEGSHANGHGAEDEAVSTNVDIVIRLSMPQDSRGNPNHGTTEELVPLLVSQIQQLLNNAGNAQTVVDHTGNARAADENSQSSSNAGNSQSNSNVGNPQSNSNAGNSQPTSNLGNSQSTSNLGNSQSTSNLGNSQTPPSPPASTSTSPKPGGVKRSSSTQSSDSQSTHSKRTHYPCFRTNTLLNHINLQSPHLLVRSPVREAEAGSGPAKSQRDCWADGQGCAQAHRHTVRPDRPRAR